MSYLFLYLYLNNVFTFLSLCVCLQMTKKLAGTAADTAAWVTNVGNEHGQVLVSVLTAGEGEGLLPMAAGLMERYRLAGVAPPPAHVRGPRLLLQLWRIKDSCHVQ